MATSAFIIRCKTEEGSYTIDNVNDRSSVKELKLCLSKKLCVEPERIKILSGYPPKVLASDVDDKTLKDVNIQSGETIIIEKITAEVFSETIKAGISTEKAKDEIAPEKVNTAMSPEKANTAISSNIGLFKSNDYGASIMMRHEVPSNNSCLFASVCFALSNGKTSSEKSRNLRRIIAKVVRGNPEKYNTAFLGMSNHDYYNWIQDVDHWGGAIELSILSEHFKMEIVAVDTMSLKMHRFGENENYSNRILLIYDGIHYDPLVLELNGATQTVFPTCDDIPLDMAMELAREAKSSRQYTDVANFTLKCLVCNENLCGDKGARDHAIVTGHVDFGEIQ